MAAKSCHQRNYSPLPVHCRVAEEASCLRAPLDRPGRASRDAQAPPERAQELICKVSPQVSQRPDLDDDRIRPEAHVCGQPFVAVGYDTPACEGHHRDRRELRALSHRLPVRRDRLRVMGHLKQIDDPIDRQLAEPVAREIWVERPLYSTHATESGNFACRVHRARA